MGRVGRHRHIPLGLQPIDQNLDILPGQRAGAGYVRDSLRSQATEKPQDAPAPLRKIILPRHQSRGLPQLVSQRSDFRKQSPQAGAPASFGAGRGQPQVGGKGRQP